VYSLPVNSVVVCETPLGPVVTMLGAVTFLIAMLIQVGMSLALFRKF